MSLTVTPIQPAIGVEITGMSASQLVTRKPPTSADVCSTPTGSSCTAR